MFVLRVAVGTVVPSAPSIIVRFQNGIDGEICNWRTRKLQYVPLSRGGVTSCGSVSMRLVPLSRAHLSIAPRRRPHRARGQDGMCDWMGPAGGHLVTNTGRKHISFTSGKSLFISQLLQPFSRRYNTQVRDPFFTVVCYLDFGVVNGSI